MPRLAGSSCNTFAIQDFTDGLQGTATMPVRLAIQLTDTVKGCTFTGS
jgi:hypothetical protein